MRSVRLTTSPRAVVRRQATPAGGWAAMASSALAPASGTSQLPSHGLRLPLGPTARPAPAGPGDGLDGAGSHSRPPPECGTLSRHDRFGAARARPVAREQQVPLPGLPSSHRCGRGLGCRLVVSRCRPRRHRRPRYQEKVLAGLTAASPGPSGPLPGTATRISYLRHSPTPPTRAGTAMAGAAGARGVPQSGIPYRRLASGSRPRSGPPARRGPRRSRKG